MAGEHQSIRLHQRCEARKNLVLGWLVEIDHHIPTKDDVERPFDCIALIEQIETLKLDQALQFRADGYKPLLRSRAAQEKFAQTLGRQFLHPLDRIDTFLCSG